MQKYLSIIFAISLISGLFGCSSSENEESGSSSSVSESSEKETEKVTEKATEKATEKPTEKEISELKQYKLDRELNVSEFSMKVPSELETVKDTVTESGSLYVYNDDSIEFSMLEFYVQNLSLFVNDEKEFLKEQNEKTLSSINVDDVSEQFITIDNHCILTTHYIKDNRENCVAYKFISGDYVYDLMIRGNLIIDINQISSLGDSIIKTIQFNKKSSDESVTTPENNNESIEQETEEKIFSGNGDVVTEKFTGNGLKTFEAIYNGEGVFFCSLYDTDGNAIKPGLFSSYGEYSGQKTATLEEGKEYIIEVTSDSEWIITMK